MNNKQKGTYNSILDSLLYGNREVKEITTTSNDFNNDISIMLETGIIDENESPSGYLLRSCYSFNIGEKGGIFVYTNHGKKYVKPYDLIMMDIYH